jgi:hypothetical protein
LIGTLTQIGTHEEIKKGQTQGVFSSVWRAPLPRNQISSGDSAGDISRYAAMDNPKGLAAEGNTAASRRGAGSF